MSGLRATGLSMLAARRRDIRLAVPTCSITFDDVPFSAVEHGVPVLRRHGVNATFYVAAGLRREDGFLDPETVRTLADGGFDIACHTYSHYRLCAGTAAGIAEDATRNRMAFSTDFSIAPPRDYSYPFGEVTVAAKRVLGVHYATMRSIYPGVNARRSDLLLLRANPVYSLSIRWAEISRLLRQAVRHSGWLIFYTHGIEPAPDDWGCTAEDLDRLLHECKLAGMHFRTVRSVSTELYTNDLLSAGRVPPTDPRRTVPPEHQVG